MAADAAHPGDGQALFGQHRDDEIVGNGKDLGIQSVGGQHPADAFLHPEGLRAAHGQLIAQIAGKVNQCNVVHRNPHCLEYWKTVYHKAGK